MRSSSTRAAGWLITTAALAAAWIPRGLSAAEPEPARVPDPRVEAKARFDRGKQLFDEKDYAGALVEFQRAYVLAPSPVTLCNMGLLYVEMRRPVEAVDALAGALHDPRALPEAYVEKARAALADQQARVGRVSVTTNVPAALELDGVEAGQTPLSAPLRAAEGLRALGASAPGYLPVRREVRVVGGADAEIDFVLAPAIVGSASLTVTANVSEADTLLDGVSVGRTPFAASLRVSPGNHQVVVRRDGYVPAARSIAIPAGGTGAVSVELQEDPNAAPTARGTLAIETGQPAATLTIDGRARGAYRGERLELPRGAHHLRVESAGFVTAERDVTVQAGAENKLQIALEPTAETYLARTRVAHRQRTWGWIATAGGLALGGVAGVLAWHYTGAVTDARTALTVFEKKYDPTSTYCDFLHPEPSGCAAADQGYYDRLNAAEDRRRVAWVGVGVGAVATAVGAYLLLTSDDPQKNDGATSGRSTAIRLPAPFVWFDGRDGVLVIRESF
jgi:hypothetical protein